MLLQHIKTENLRISLDFIFPWFSFFFFFGASSFIFHTKKINKYIDGEQNLMENEKQELGKCTKRVKYKKKNHHNKRMNII